MPQRRRRRGGAGGARGRRGHIRRFLEPCLLMLLHMGKRHGYELARELIPFGLENVDSSLVYRMLRDMEGAGLVRSEWQSNITAGPARRVYSLTTDGDRGLANWVSDLRATDGVLAHFLKIYEKHMREGTGDYH